MRKHYTEAQRATLVDLVTTGRATAREAAAQLGVTESTAYYWIKCAKRSRSALAVISRGAPRPAIRQPAPAPTFARLIRATEELSLVAVRVGDVIVEVRPGFDRVLLREVIAALAEPMP
jgi:transposase-like protein